MLVLSVSVLAKPQRDGLELHKQRMLSIYRSLCNSVERQRASPDASARMMPIPLNTDRVSMLAVKGS